MPVNFVTAVLLVSANASWLAGWYPVILIGVVLVLLIAVTVYGVHRALSSGDTGAAATMICLWAFLLGWLVAVVYVLVVDRPRRASGQRGQHGVADVGPFPAIDVVAGGPLGNIRNPIVGSGAIATGFSDGRGTRYVPDLEAGLTAVVEYLAWDRKWHVRGVGPTRPGSSDVAAGVPNVGRDWFRSVRRVGFAVLLVVGALVLVALYGGGGGGPHFTTVQRRAICSGSDTGCDCEIAELEGQYNQARLDRIATLAAVSGAPAPQELQNAITDCSLRQLGPAPDK